MKRFIAFLFAFVMLTIGNPMQSFSQQQDTTKPAVPASDTARPAVPGQDTAGLHTGITDSAGAGKTIKDSTGAASGADATKAESAKPKKDKKRWNIVDRIHMIGYKKREKRRYIQSVSLTACRPAGRSLD